MKVLLINPPRENEIAGNNPAIIEEERGFNPPLGLLYVAAYIERYSSHTIAVIDSQVERLSYDALAARIRDFGPDIVGLTAMTMTLIDVMKTVDLVKSINKDIRTVLGGPHVHLFPKETISLKGVDYLVLGEGEKVFKELLDRMDDLASLRKIPGLVFRDGQEIIHTGAPATILDLDAIPFPARHLVPYKKYSSLLSKGDVVTTIFSSRGCPFRCAFCDRPHLGKQFRARSAINVVDELQHCTSMGITDFLFYDDTFAVNKKRVIDICQEIVRRKLRIRWDIRTRVDTVDEEMISSLKKAGCVGIHYGIEAGTEKVLKVLNKGITLEQAVRVFDLTRKYGIPILAYFMIGNPSETREDIRATFRVMRKLNPDYVHMTILTPFPGTKIYLDGLASGIIGADYWRAFAIDPAAGFVPPHWGEKLSREELNELLVEGYRLFYLRASYIARRILGVKSFGDLKRKAKAGIKVFRM
jgi:anaerobic magnesium-protoporphyrin IX monomethyl ester cyclase